MPPKLHVPFSLLTLPHRPLCTLRHASTTPKSQVTPSDPTPPQTSPQTSPQQPSPTSPKTTAQQTSPQQASPQTQPEKHKTQAALDLELRSKLEGISGEGGAAGLELEGGLPVAMKRGVRSNMFRVI